MPSESERRGFLKAAALAGAGLVLAGRATAEGPGRAAPTPVAGPPADVNATEDLMREHGVLRRVLLLYGESARRLQAGAPPPADLIGSAAGVIKGFIEAYHERLEEEEVFPRLVKAGQLLDLVSVLVAQHRAGRRLTGEILELATPAALKRKASGQQLATNLEQFIRMYAPHAAREDTILFPAFHAMFSEKEFDALGDRFEEKERQVLGAAGFEGTVAQVAELEKALGIYDLAQFTPS